MSSRLVILRDAHQDCKRDQRRNRLHQRRAFKRAEPASDNGAWRKSSPDAAAQITECLPAAVNATKFHGPSRPSGVKTCLAKTLQHSPQICSADTKGSQVGGARQ